MPPGDRPRRSLPPLRRGKPCPAAFARRRETHDGQFPQERGMPIGCRCRRDACPGRQRGSSAVDGVQPADPSGARQPDGIAVRRTPPASGSASPSSRGLRHPRQPGSVWRNSSAMASPGSAAITSVPRSCSTTVAIAVPAPTSATRTLGQTTAGELLKALEERGWVRRAGSRRAEQRLHRTTGRVSRRSCPRHHLPRPGGPPR